MSANGPRRTVRLRITVLYAVLFAVTGTALMVITYLLVKYAIGNPARPLSHVEGTAFGPPDGTGPPVQVTYSSVAVPLDAVMRSLVSQSALALGIMTVISMVLGWVLAGRLLRPLRTITASVRDISATNLHLRLTMTGPADELKELGDTFDGLLDRLESSFRAQRQFVANASHELRTPLARQRVLGQVAVTDPEATVGSLRAAHERILVAGEQQERMIEALLTLTRSQAGLDSREPVDLARIARETVAGRADEAAERAVSVEADATSAVIAGHRGLTERLVANLVDNALRYNKPGGRVRVSTATAGSRAGLIVANSGPVVPADAVESLFQPFHRLDGTRTASAGGLGLGLSIVRAVADAHDATVDIAAPDAGGLVVTVSFPSVTSNIGALTR
jgi:signal transduction histidine kinase